MAVDQLVVVVKDGSRRRVLGVEPRVSGRKRRHVKSVVRSVFVPEAITPAYFPYSAWRCLQRLLSATVQVFGVQAMIMAVGGPGRAIGAAAAIDWVLKDALGKVTRLVWAGKMGREFDGDAKRWRFRSSLLYATGNGLQIATFAFPHLFLLLATVANSLKQISLLTSTATRSAIYRSFALTESTNNIGDITAKGEAQIAVVDLLGMSLGIALTKFVGFGSDGRQRLLGLYACISFLEICAMYQEIRCVVFRQLNFERAKSVVGAFVAGSDTLPTPTLAASKERILRGAPRPVHLVFPPNPRRTLAKIQREQLEQILHVFRDQPFLVVPLSPKARPRRRYGVLLKSDAKEIDILRSLLALNLAEERHAGPLQEDDVPALRGALQDADLRFDDLLAAMEAADWSTTSFMFPDVRTRLDWPAIDHS